MGESAWVGASEGWYLCIFDSGLNICSSHIFRWVGSLTPRWLERQLLVKQGKLAATTPYTVWGRRVLGQWKSVLMEKHQGGSQRARRRWRSRPNRQFLPTDIGPQGSAVACQGSKSRPGMVMAKAKENNEFWPASLKSARNIISSYRVDSKQRYFDLMTCLWRLFWTTVHGRLGDITPHLLRTSPLL